MRRAQGLGDGLLDLGGERDRATRAGRDVVPPDLAFRRCDDRAAVGHPRIPREYAVEGEALLLITLHAIGQQADAPGAEIHGLDPRSASYAPDESQRAAVRAHCRSGRAAELACHRDDLPGATIETLDLPDALVHVAVVPVAAVAGGEVHEAAVPGKRRVRRVGLLLALRELDSLAALDVPHPQLDGAEGGHVGQALSPDDVLSVRRPGRRGDWGFLLAAHRTGVLSGQVADPQVLEPAAVAREGDPVAIGAEARLHVVGGPAGDPLRLAAADRQEVEVAQQREDDALAVGVDVEVQPGALVGAERDRLGRAFGIVHRPRLLGLDRGFRVRLLGLRG